MQAIVTVIVQKGREFWFSRPPGKSWDFPCRPVAETEQVEDAARKALLENAGIRVEPVNLLAKETRGENIIHYQLCECVCEGNASTKQQGFLCGQWMSADDIIELSGNKMLAPVAQYMKAFKSNRPQVWF